MSGLDPGSEKLSDSRQGQTVIDPDAKVAILLTWKRVFALLGGIAVITFGAWFQLYAQIGEIAQSIAHLEGRVDEIAARISDLFMAD